ncbi:Cytidine and deoxycytidylate deaminase zinc-binding region [Geosmithia morbida]|uniref:Cytidine and deoxycytidylate deaminase zinc-binding region n=1 Tax=Geosmithia morbida TaxID=1094350 RepID=A0A9P4YTZ3_9HYPO|nr:Cytidine and deoxycytidylate deaminase zinc-binding region [Geosmithia morbida]KAF4122775.1 Cytidine and deoxycytidylate deaminase zinc-binding region [Geosmithia morbida]
MSETNHTPQDLCDALLSTIENDIIPLTRTAVASGSKVFGAAILDIRTLQVLTVATNDERASPLLHGEVNCIQKFFTESFPLPSASASASTSSSTPSSSTSVSAATPSSSPTSVPGRPSPSADCIFLATHEPCSLCLSAIAWSGFTRVYHLFTHDDSRRLFAIPHDIDILQQVFRVRSEASSETEDQLARRPLYNRRNRFFTAMSIDELAATAAATAPPARTSTPTATSAAPDGLTTRINAIKQMYSSLDRTYQDAKASGVATSSIWK